MTPRRHVRQRMRMPRYVIAQAAQVRRFARPENNRLHAPPVCRCSFAAAPRRRDAEAPPPARMSSNIGTSLPYRINRDSADRPRECSISKRYSRSAPSKLVNANALAVRSTHSSKMAANAASSYALPEGRQLHAQGGDKSVAGGSLAPRPVYQRRSRIMATHRMECRHTTNDGSIAHFRTPDVTAQMIARRVAHRPSSETPHTYSPQHLQCGGRMAEYGRFSSKQPRTAYGENEYREQSRYAAASFSRLKIFTASPHTRAAAC